MTGFNRGALVALASVALAAALTTATDAKVFRWADTRRVETMEPYLSSNVFPNGFIANMYEPLVNVDDTGTLVGLLATDWKQIEPTKWRYTLRKGVKFHGGESFSADDVVFSFNRALSKNSVMNSALSTTDKVTKVDDYTVDITTRDIDPIHPRNIRTVMMMSKSWAESHNAVEVGARDGTSESFANRNVDGTGPFKLVRWVPGVSVEMVSFDDWWGGKRKDQMTGAKFFEITEPATQLAALLSGDMDLIANVPPALLDRVKNSPGVKLIQGAAMQTMMLGMDEAHDELTESNVKGKNPFKDIRVRQAIFYAIDVDAIIDKVMRGQGIPSALLVSSIVNGWDKDLSKRDPANPAKARQLLADAGYPDGFEVGFDCTSGYYLNDEPVCQAVATMLAQVGIRTKLITATGAVHMTKIQSPKFAGTFFLYSLTGSTFDAGSLFNNTVRTRNVAAKTGMSNVSGYSNPQMDKIADALQIESDPVKRQALFHDGWKLMKDELPLLPLFQNTIIWAARDNVEVTTDPLNRLFLSKVTLN